MNGIRTAADYVLARHAEVYSPSQSSTTTGTGSTNNNKNPKKALVVCVELSSVNGVFKPELNDVIISSLFGDGCAALVLSARTDTSSSLLPGEISLQGSFSRLVEGTSDGITLGVNHDGITCELSPALPKYIRSAVGGAVENVLRDHGLTKEEVTHWAIHPGGPKIIEESLSSLGLSDDVARLSWEMLRRYGNMLSVSLPFVLQAMAAEVVSASTATTITTATATTKTKKGEISTGVAFSFGPGITVEGVVFDISSGANGSSESSGSLESTASSLSSASLTTSSSSLALASEMEKGQSPVMVLDAGMLADFSALGVCGSHMG